MKRSETDREEEKFMMQQGGSVHITDTFMWKSHQCYVLLMLRSMETDSLIIRLLTHANIIHPD